MYICIYIYIFRQTLACLAVYASLNLEQYSMCFLCTYFALQSISSWLGDASPHAAFVGFTYCSLPMIKVSHEQWLIGCLKVAKCVEDWYGNIHFVRTSRNNCKIYRFRCYLIKYYHDCQIRSYTQIAKFKVPTWSPHGSCRPQMGPMLAPWTLLSGY